LDNKPPLLALKKQKTRSDPTSEDLTWEILLGVFAEFTAGVFFVSVKGKYQYIWKWNKDGYQGGKGGSSLEIYYGEAGAAVAAGGKFSASSEWTLMSLLGSDPIGD